MENLLKDHGLPTNDPEYHINNKIAERQRAEFAREAAHSKIKSALHDLTEEELHEKYERSSAKLKQLESSILTDLPDITKKEELERQREMAHTATENATSELDKAER